MNESASFEARQPYWVYVGPVLLGTYPDLDQLDETFHHLIKRSCYEQKSQRPGVPPW